LKRDERGNMSVLFAMGFAISAVVSAVAVDGVSLYNERRQVQSVVDLAAISAATDPGAALEIAQSVLVDAGLLAADSTDGLSVATGFYTPDPALAPKQRFVRNSGNINAVEVRFERPGTLYFAAGLSRPPTISASGLATVTPEVSFSVGSRLASLNGGIANAILSRLLGTSVSLSVVDYNALASAHVDALQFLDALAMQLGISAGTYDDVLTTKAGSGSVAAALSGLVNGTAKTALNKLSSGGGSKVDMGKLLDLGALGRLMLGSAGAVTGLNISALELLSAVALLSDGDRQVSLDLDAKVPGLVSLGLDVAIGEPPQGGGWFAVGPLGTIVRTAQVRVRLSAQVLGGPLLVGATVELPLWIDIAHSEARVVSAACPSSSAPNGRASIAVRPGVLHAAVGEMSDSAMTQFGWLPAPKSVRLIDVLLLKVSGRAQAEIAQTTPVLLSFTSAEIGVGQLKTAKTTTPIQSLASSLLGSLDLSVNVLGLGLSPPSVIAQAVRALVMPLAPTLDMTLNAVLSTLGVGIGEADIRVYSVRCTNAVLVG
jgi:uncharacterized membrane protein